MASGEGGQGARGLRWTRPTSASTFNFLFQLDPVCKLQGFFMNYESYSMPGTQMLNTNLTFKISGTTLIESFPEHHVEHTGLPGMGQIPPKKALSRLLPRPSCQALFRGLLIHQLILFSPKTQRRRGIIAPNL